MTISQLIEIIRARWVIVLGVLLLGICAAVAITAILPASYKSSTDLVISGTDPQVEDGPEAQINLPYYLKTQIDILSSDRVVQRAVQNLKLTEDPEILKSYAKGSQGLSIEQYCIALVRKKMSVLPTKDSRLVRIVFESSDPVRAASVANGLAEAFIEVNSDLIVANAKRSAAEFNRHAGDLREQLTAAQQRLAEYRRKNGLVGVDDKDDLRYSTLNALSNELASAQGQLIQAKENYAIATKALQSGNTTSSTNLITSPLLVELLVEEGRARTELQSMSNRIGANHPDYLQQRRRIESVRAQINAERKKIVEGLAFEVDMSSQRVKALSEEVSSQTQTLLTARASQEQLNALVQEIGNAQRAYDIVLQQYSTAAVNSTGRDVSISVLTEAIPAPVGSGRSYKKAIIFGGVLGLLGGVVGAALKELADTRIRVIDDVDRWLAVPNLVEIPMMNAPDPVLFKKATAALSQTRTFRITDMSGGDGGRDSGETPNTQAF